MYFICTDRDLATNTPSLPNIPSQTGLIPDQYTRFRDLSRAFAEWDNSNHQGALDLLQRYARILPADLSCYFDAAKRLNNDDLILREAAQ